jgi:hypothetical protein
VEKSQFSHTTKLKSYFTTYMSSTLEHAAKWVPSTIIVIYSSSINSVFASRVFVPTSSSAANWDSRVIIQNFGVHA